MEITHVRNSDIDRVRWDSCIAQSNNQLTYAYSWYLDIVSPHWEALVTSDYEYVMPLPVKRRYKIPYLVQPILTQQLGIFSRSEINEDLVEEFIKGIPYFSYELNLNDHNFCSKALVFPNFLLNLQQPYKQIVAMYTKNTQRNIEKATKLNLKVQSDISVDEFLNFYSSVEKKYLPVRMSVLEKLLKMGVSLNTLSIYGVFSTNNKLIAGLCLLNSPRRLTYLLPVSDNEGKTSLAMFLLIDSLIKKEAGKEKILDFEGSVIDGIARFYRGFGAKNKPYYILKRFRPSFLIGK
jgi:hypothetical protein